MKISIMAIADQIGLVKFFSLREHPSLQEFEERCKDISERFGLEYKTAETSVTFKKGRWTTRIEYNIREEK